MCARHVNARPVCAHVNPYVNPACVCAHVYMCVCRVPVPCSQEHDVNSAIVDKYPIDIPDMGLWGNLLRTGIFKEIARKIAQRIKDCEEKYRFAMENWHNQPALGFIDLCAGCGAFLIGYLPCFVEAMKDICCVVMRYEILYVADIDPVSREFLVALGYQRVFGDIRELVHGSRNAPEPGMAWNYAKGRHERIPKRTSSGREPIVMGGPECGDQSSNNAHRKKNIETDTIAAGSSPTSSSFLGLRDVAVDVQSPSVLLENTDKAEGRTLSMSLFDEMQQQFLSGNYRFRCGYRIGKADTYSPQPRRRTYIQAGIGRLAVHIRSGRWKAWATDFEDAMSECKRPLQEHVLHGVQAAANLSIYLQTKRTRNFRSYEGELAAAMPYYAQTPNLSFPPILPPSSEQKSYFDIPSQSFFSGPEGFTERGKLIMDWLYKCIDFRSQMPTATADTFHVGMLTINESIKQRLATKQLVIDSYPVITEKMELMIHMDEGCGDRDSVASVDEFFGVQMMPLCDPFPDPEKMKAVILKLGYAPLVSLAGRGYSLPCCVCSMTSAMLLLPVNNHITVAEEEKQLRSLGLV